MDLNNRIEFDPGPPDYILFTEKDRKEEEELLRRARIVYADGYTTQDQKPENLTISEIEKAESARRKDAKEMEKFVKFIKGNNDTNDKHLNQKYLKYLWKVKKKLDNRNDITFVFGAGNAFGDNTMGGNDMKKFKNHDIVSNNSSLSHPENYNLDNFEPMWLQLDYSIPMEDLKKTPTWIFCNKYLKDKVKLAYFDIGSVWGSSLYVDHENTTFFLKWFVNHCLTNNGQLFFPLERGELTMPDKKKLFPDNLNDSNLDMKFWDNKFKRNLLMGNTIIVKELSDNELIRSGTKYFDTSIANLNKNWSYDTYINKILENMKIRPSEEWNLHFKGRSKVYFLILRNNDNSL